MTTTNLHYELTDESIRTNLGPTLHRIRATRDLPYHGVKAGDLGGYVESTDNLIEDGWVTANGRLFGGSLVYGKGLVGNSAMMFGNTRLGDYSRLSGHTRLIGRARMFGNALVIGNSWVADGAQIFGNARLLGESVVTGHAQVCGDARLDGNDWVSGNALITGPLDILTATIYTRTRLDCTLHRTTTGWSVTVGCWTGSVPELRMMAESGTWVETPADEIDEVRPELLSFVALCEARINRMTEQEN